MKAIWEDMVPQQPLTDDEKTKVENTADNRLGGLVMMAKAMFAMNPSVMMARLIEADAIVEALEPGTLLPLLTGHGGAVRLTRERFLTLGQMLMEILVVYQTYATADPTLLVDAIGTDNA